MDTPLLMAVGSHQDRVVAKLLEQGHDPMQVGGHVCVCASARVCTLKGWNTQ